MKFSDYVRIWLEQTARKVDDVTMQGYRILAEGHILPYFDALGISLSDVDHKIIQKYVDIKHESGRKDGQGGLSPRSLKLHNNVILRTIAGNVRNPIFFAANIRR